MNKLPSAPSGRFTCEFCPLRGSRFFRDLKPEELAHIKQFRKGELTVDKGSTVLVEGSRSAHLYTILTGWAFRYKLLPDGRRQILNFMVPGDLLGLQAAMMGEMEHSVEALSPMILCVFDRDMLSHLFRHAPSLGYDITWIAAREERLLDENLLSVGRRTALERTAYLLAYIYHRAAGAGLVIDRTEGFGLTQQHVADTLGLSLVHTNKTIGKLARRGLVRWHARGCHVLDPQGLMELAGWDGLQEGVRPFI